MKRIALSEVKDDLSRFLRLAEKEEVLITRHGKPAGVLIGFQDEDDWFDYRFEHDPRFLARVDAARESLRAGRGVRIEALSRLAGRGHAARGSAAKAKALGGALRSPASVKPRRSRRGR
ncbi:MAG: type II toxin-antitoxin system Phd/YefM family antitoxin [Planctomycetes bacterium]|nr:type II toxin-antitoxin system Phd/YefM family antitoxin [Planctomycetota bacterium]